MDGAYDILFAATLRPNPPLKPSALKAIFLAVAGINAGFALLMLSRGAWPVLPFLGLDVALLGWAFRSSTLAAQREERLTLTVAALEVLRLPSRILTSLNPYWLRVQEDERSGLALVSHGKAVKIGSFLGPAERDALAQKLKEALWRAKQRW